MSDEKPVPVLSLQPGFEFGEVPSDPASRAARASSAATVPPLGPLAAFAGTFTGNGFNTIFRPDSAATPTPLPAAPVGPNDNVLELNLTAETLSFSPSLGSVPNRGFRQGDIFLNGVPYLQSISDITVPAQPIGIHLEPGVWMHVPATTVPKEGTTLVRMASIPHGTVIQAQGTSSTATGKPVIPAVDITPFTPPDNKITFPSQTASATNTERIPQDLTSFIAAGTITQAILNDPNTVLRHHIASQDITSTTTIQVTNSPVSPLFGGGRRNIAFLLGDAKGAAPNAQAGEVTATFWIETVQYVIEVPVFALGDPPLTIPAPAGAAGPPVPQFLVDPPAAITTPVSITVTATQIQYSQRVILNFNGISWPHVSVATLVPASPIPVPASAFA